MVCLECADDKISTFLPISALLLKGQNAFPHAAHSLSSLKMLTTVRRASLHGACDLQLCKIASVAWKVPLLSIPSQCILGMLSPHCNNPHGAQNGSSRCMLWCNDCGNCEGRPQGALGYCTDGTHRAVQEKLGKPPGFHSQGDRSLWAKAVNEIVSRNFYWRCTATSTTPAVHVMSPALTTATGAPSRQQREWMFTPPAGSGQASKLD